MIPNLISLSRVFLAATLFFLSAKQKILVIFLAGLTDFFDGYIARRFSRFSNIGKWLDPLSDKIFLVCLYGSLVYEGLVPLWVFSLFMTRDICLVLGFLVIKKIDIHISSKVNTLMQGVYPMAILFNIFPIFFMWTALATTVISGLIYLKKFIDTRTSWRSKARHQ